MQGLLSNMTRHTACLPCAGTFTILGVSKAASNILSDLSVNDWAVTLPSTMQPVGTLQLAQPTAHPTQQWHATPTDHQSATQALPAQLMRPQVAPSAPTDHTSNAAHPAPLQGAAAAEHAGVGGGQQAAIQMQEPLHSGARQLHFQRHASQPPTLQVMLAVMDAMPPTRSIGQYGK